MRSIKQISIVFFAFLLCDAALATGVNTNALLTDTRVVYVYDQHDHIDWPLVYYFAQENGCQVDLVTVKSGPVYKRLLLESDKYNITLSRFFLPEILYNYLDSAAHELYLKDHPESSLEHLDSAARELYSNYLPDSSVEYLISLARELYGENLPEVTVDYLDTVAADLFGEYRPDIVIFSSDFENNELNTFKQYLLNIEFDSTNIFNIQKYLLRSGNGNKGGIYLNSGQYFRDLSQEITDMARSVGESPPLPGRTETYSVYELIKDNTKSLTDAPDFFAGIDKLKFGELSKKHIQSPGSRKTFETHLNKYISNIEKARHQNGQQKIESLMAALEEIQKIGSTYYNQISKAESHSPLGEYIERTIGALSNAIFQEADIDYSAYIEVRDTPGRKKLKFRAEINNNGYLNIESGWLEMVNPATAKRKILDSSWAVIRPNNSFIRSYTIDLDKGTRAIDNAAEYKFVGRLRYGGEEVCYTYGAGAYDESPLSVEFVPDFLMIKPFEGLKVDRLIEPAELKAIIHKPTDFTGDVNIKVSTPDGILAGAFKERIKLPSGQKAIEMDIPLVMTQSAGTGKLPIEISILKEGKVIASNVANIRQITFNIPENLNIALFPDDKGLLEDILIETGARYRPISERFLASGDFDLYDVILFGTQCFKKYQSLDIIRDKIRSFLEYGGTVIVFGQPDEWRDDLLPISIISTATAMQTRDYSIEVRNSKIFNSKFTVDPDKLLSEIHSGYISYPAIVFPGEKIIKGHNNTSILARTKLGEGQLIYCGLPLLEMIRKLDVEAIKFYSNLLHYAGK